MTTNIERNMDTINKFELHNMTLYNYLYIGTNKLFISILLIFEIDNIPVHDEMETA